jgi:hypothetical protein
MAKKGKDRVGGIKNSDRCKLARVAIPVNVCTDRDEKKYQFSAVNNTSEMIINDVAVKTRESHPTKVGGVGKTSSETATV